MISSEIWRPVVGYEGLYEVSNLGRVRSAFRCGTRGCILKQKRVGNGNYLTVGLSKHHHQTFIPVHRLVCEAWHGPPPFENARVLHWDDNKDNNIPNNLRWGTSMENADDAKRNNRSPRGENHGRAKVSREDVEQIRLLHKQGVSQLELAGRYNIGSSAVSNIVNRKTWVE
jgi:hypothetical protein